MRIFRSLALTVLLSFTALLTACGGGLSGTYVDASHTWTIVFHSNGTVDVESVAGQARSGHYRMDGDKVVLTADGVPDTVLHRDAQGHLLLMGQPLTKQEN